MVVDLKDKQREKWVQSFLKASQDKKQLDQWKKQNEDKKKNGAYRF